MKGREEGVPLKGLSAPLDGPMGMSFLKISTTKRPSQTAPRSAKLRGDLRLNTPIAVFSLTFGLTMKVKAVKEGKR